MKKTNVSSEVLILPKNLEKSALEWTPKKLEKDECFERGLDFEPILEPILEPQEDPTPANTGHRRAPVEVLLPLAQS